MFLAHVFPGAARLFKPDLEALYCALPALLRGALLAFYWFPHSVQQHLADERRDFRARVLGRAAERVAGALHHLRERGVFGSELLLLFFKLEHGLLFFREVRVFGKREALEE